MDTEELAKAADPTSLADFVAGLPEPHQHGAGGTIETLREEEHKGHRITIRTTYQIEVDGKPFQGDLALGNDGELHIHSLPNYQFASAVDMVKRLIDTFPEDFPAPNEQGSSSKKPSRRTGGGGHHHEPEGGR